MNFAASQLAEYLVAERTEAALRRAEEATWVDDATPHRVRAALGRTLIRMGVSLLPRPVERPPTPQTSPPC